MMYIRNVGTAKNDNHIFGALLNKVFGRNSPVKSTMIVESTVSAGTVKLGSKPLKMVLSNNFAMSMP